MIRFKDKSHCQKCYVKISPEEYTHWGKLCAACHDKRDQEKFCDDKWHHPSAKSSGFIANPRKKSWSSKKVEFRQIY